MAAEEQKVVLEEEDDVIVDYDETEEAGADADKADAKAKEVKKGSYVGIHATGFRDFLLKSELLQAVQDIGFEHPSEVQQECIPQAVLGMDVICQAKSGMGKTAVFVLATLQQLTPNEEHVNSLVLCHVRELAFQICEEFIRFSKYMPEVRNRIKVFYGGFPVKLHREMLEKETPLIVIGCPGRIKQLVDEKKLKLDHLKRFVMDECDEMLRSDRMRRDVQNIFFTTPHEKQVMMFSATLSKEVRPICKKFTQDGCVEIYVDDESKLTLHGLQQYYVRLAEKEKNKKLTNLLDALEFNQVVIFVNSVKRCKELNNLLVECNFPSMAIHAGLKQEERLERYNKFKHYKSRILVSTDVFGRGVDFERVNIVINYDMPTTADQYLHRVGRSGRFGTKGLGITFVSNTEDSEILNQVQSRFEVEISEMPDSIDTSTYMTA